MITVTTSDLATHAFLRGMAPGHLDAAKLPRVMAFGAIPFLLSPGLPGCRWISDERIARE
jgi:hypothetical protein